MNAGEMTIGAHAYGYYEDKDGNYVMVKPFVVNAMPDSPFWQDAVKKGFIADLRTASVGPIPNQPFVGSEVEPKPVVTVDNDLGTVRRAWTTS